VKKAAKKTPAAKSGPRKRPARPSDAELDATIEAMDRDLDDPQLISGIYNYCDRWCERCPMTTRCLTFRTLQREQAAHGERSRDAKNQEFWDGVGKSFAVAMRMLERDAKKHGFDFNDPAVRKETERELRRQERRSQREGRTLNEASKKYYETVETLLAELRPALEDVLEELNAQIRLGAGTPRETAHEITDALEVAQWYQHFIHVKLQRAVGSRVFESEERDETLRAYPRDSDGSAKVALIAIDRSMAAWAALRERFESRHGDAILDLLVQLERLRRAVEAEFPQARAFQRPGFDAGNEPR
jgi:hypothetical protein